MSQRDSNPPEIQEFVDWTKSNHTKRFFQVEPDSQNRKLFIPPAKVKAFFEKDNRLQRLLAALFTQQIVVPPEAILRNYNVVFAILLFIGRGSSIQYFTPHSSLNDEHLPVDPANPPANFPDNPRDRNFYKEFCDAQMKFCAPFFDILARKTFEHDRILPITVNTEIGRGGSAIVSRIQIDELHNGLILDDQKNLLQEGKDTFALKTFFPHAVRNFNAEVDAFNAVQHRTCPGIIGYHGNFIQKENHHIIMQFADKGTLEDYFRKQEPPTNGEDALKLWANLFELDTALMQIHNPKRLKSDAVEHFKGIHHDVKPENVLVVSNGQQSPYLWNLKLGDLGLCSVWKGESSQDDVFNDNFGTQTYGAPECHRSDTFTSHSELPITSKADIWSLGCIYSEAARWITTNGKKGLEAYREERKEESSRIRSLGCADTFHDGEKQLKAVIKSHELCRSSIRANDYLTPKVLDMLEDMLEALPSGRLDAIQVHNKSRRILGQAQGELKSVAGTSYHERSGGRLPPELPPGTPAILNQFGSVGKISTPKSRENRSHSNVGSFLEDGRQSHSPNELFDDEVELASSRIPLPKSGSSFRSFKQSKRPLNEQHAVSDGNFDLGTSSDIYSLKRDVEEIGSYRSEGAAGHVTVDRFGSPKPANERPTQRNSTTQSSTMSQLAGHVQNERATTPQHHSGSNPTRSSRSPSSPLNPLSEEMFSRPLSHPASDKRPHSTTNMIGTPPDQIPNGTEGSQMRQMSMLPARQTLLASSIGPSHPPVKIQQLLDWKLAKKKSGTTVRSLPRANLLQRLYGRDQVFLIDNSSSMKDHWTNVLKAFEALSYIVKRPEIDNDGIELYIANPQSSQDRYKKSKSTSGLLEMLGRQKCQGETDMAGCLNQILGPYQQKLQKLETRKSFSWWMTPQVDTPRPMNVYILTDGLWEDQQAVERPIQQLVQVIEQFKLPKEQVGIQFISFGNNAQGLQGMEHLDSELGEGLDIVDHTPSDGDIWKMLLGGFNNFWDGDNKANRFSSNTRASSHYRSPTNETRAMDKDQDYDA